MTEKLTLSLASTPGNALEIPVRSMRLCLASVAAMQALPVACIDGSSQTYPNKPGSTSAKLTDTNGFLTTWQVPG
jgi:hypothetical protein